MKKISYLLVFYVGLIAAIASQSAYAIDSYRYLHVTIDTPWSIFLFLLIGIFAPFILMAVLIWRYSTRYKSDEESTEVNHDSGQN
ncbi:hypothetical protein LHV13_01705 [Ferrovum sp. PN-J185]|uniref:hypothetical protein n=1 Tax=Ferrovum sp. PN-J185 TaxID=1356306 RepID=UPI00079443F8|nr:hypothetical protein [Ferrovum sp. PN-J185]KXW55548.1 hypothetical protein FV185_13160 [Ferrovum sp. PN-J185]MCC6067896.1 hypothetical protein [Ferrovum sp. PN-J185]